MGIRFRRRIKLAPGLHLNISGSGLSLSAGPRGASVTFGGRRGTHMNAGIPGSGLYTRGRIDTPNRSPRADYATSNGDNDTVSMPVKISVEDDGAVIFRDQDDRILDDALVRRVKQVAKDDVVGLMESACKQINGHIEALETIHHATPSPSMRAAHELRPYEEPEPSKPTLPKYGILDRFFSSRRARLTQQIAEAEATYNDNVRNWNRRRQEHESRELARKAVFEKKVLTDVAAMEIVLEESLMDIIWPRETIVSAEIRDSGRLVMI
ncbi:MAG: DUF4236 domain-containing protein, partial [Planctomycetales bacterium]|nr:DUF4236 domain-containing protein [Planctomycetales bacterium]